MGSSVINEADRFIDAVNKIELENNAAIRSREQLMESVKQIREENKENSELYDITTHAIEILKQLSDTAVQDAYRFIEASINDALEKMFRGTTRQIKINEYLREEKYPQLEIELHVGNGIVRSLKTDSGHGIAQIISLLSILCLIVLTGARRILCIDEVLSGLSTENREVITDILWSFVEIGFQFIIIEHGYIPRGAKVYELALDGDIGKVVDSYVAVNGVYLQSSEMDNKEYKDVAMKMKEEATKDSDNLPVGGNNGIVSI